MRAGPVRVALAVAVRLGLGSDLDMRKLFSMFRS